MPTFKKYQSYKCRTYLPSLDSFSKLFIQHDHYGHHMWVGCFWMVVWPQIVLQVLAELQHHDAAYWETAKITHTVTIKSPPLRANVKHMLLLCNYWSFWMDKILMNIGVLCFQRNPSHFWGKCLMVPTLMCSQENCTGSLHVLFYENTWYNRRKL